MSRRGSSSDPQRYKDAVIYQLHVRSFSDQNNDGIGDFAGLIEKLDYLKELGVSCLWLLPFYPSPLRDDGYDIAHYEESILVRHDEGLPRVPARRARPRPAGRDGARDQPHVGPAPVVSGRAPRAGRLGEAEVLRVERHEAALRGRAHHLHRQRDVELAVGSRRERVLLAPFFLSPARPELRQPARPQRGPESHALLVRPGVSTACASTPCPISSSGRAPPARTCPRRTSSSATSAAIWTRGTTGGCCWPRRTSGRPTSARFTARATSATCASTSR